MDNFVSSPTAHSHGPAPDVLPVLELKSQIKTRAATTDEQTSAILHSALRTFPLHAAGQLPRSNSLMNTIRRQRSTPKISDEGVLADHLRKTDRSEDFILYEDKSLIIFTTQTNLSVLKRCKHWFADGAFKVSQITIRYSG